VARCSRRSSQRRGRRIHEQCDLNETIRGLNWLAGAPLDKGVFGPSPRQQEVLGRVTAACHRASLKPDLVTPLSPEAAFSELLRGNASVYEVIDLVDSDARQYLEAKTHRRREASQRRATASSPSLRLKQPVWMQRLFCFDPIPARWVNLQGSWGKWRRSKVRMMARVANAVGHSLKEFGSASLGRDYSAVRGLSGTSRRASLKPLRLWRVRLWDSVRAELRAFAALLPLCTAEWGRGRVPERERFRRGPAVGAGWEVDKDFIEVPRALLHKALVNDYQDTLIQPTFPG